METGDIFLKILDNLLINEGGYINDIDDTGGETIKGISRNNFPFWQGWEKIDLIKLDSNSINEINKKVNESSQIQTDIYNFYFFEFFMPLRLNHINDFDIVNEIFDTAVNCGKKTATKIIQTALNLLNNNEALYSDLIIDGLMGARTSAAIESIISRNKKAAFLVALNGEQYCYYKKITEKKPVFEKFFAGWMKRISF